MTLVGLHDAPTVPSVLMATASASWPVASSTSSSARSAALTGSPTSTSAAL